MDIYKFKIIPADTNFRIPFELSEDSFTQWLSTLENNSATEQSHQILLAIQAINREKKLPPEQKSLLLEGIYKSMVIFLVPLNKAILNSPLPLAKEEKNNNQQIISIYAELANGFTSCLSKASDLASAQTLFYGLQSLISAYVHIAEIYQDVYPGFWKQSYLFYGLASKLEIQNLNIEQHCDHSNTISKAFKHLLALYHCGLEQFRPRDMMMISTCIEKHTEKMLLSKRIPGDKSPQYSAFDLKLDKSPSNASRLNQSEKSIIRFFSAYSVALEINKNASHVAPGTGVIKAINRENILQVAKTLSLSQKRKFTRFNKEVEHNGIVGFSHIIEYLRESSSLQHNPTDKKAIDPMDARVSGGWEVPNIELVSEGYESIDALKRNYDQSGLLREEQSRLNQAEKNSASKNIWAKADTEPQNDSSSIRLEKFNTLDFSIKGYKIIFDTDLNPSKIQIGDIVGIKNNNNMEIGIIRRIEQLTEHKLQLGIKLLALESEIAYISLPNHDSIYAWAIFLPGIKKIIPSDSLIYNDSKFQCGEFINLHRADTEPASCRLNKLLHQSSAAMHIELFNSKVME